MRWTIRVICYQKVLPFKNANLSPEQKKGKLRISSSLTRDLFAGAIAKNRNVDITTIIEKYGQGEVFFSIGGQRERGLIDAIVDDFDACIEMIKPSIAGAQEKVWQMK